MAPGGDGGNKVFGQTMSKRGGGGSSRYQRQFGGGQKNPATVYRSADDQNDDAQQAARVAAEKRRQRQALGQELDRKLGFERFALTGNLPEAEVVASSHHAHAAPEEPSPGDPMERRGWLFQMLPTTVNVADRTTTTATGVSAERSGLDLYMLEASGKKFTTTVLFRPYFYVLIQESLLLNSTAARLESSDEASSSQLEIGLELIKSTLFRLLGGDSIHAIEIVARTDLDQPNHLSTGGRPLLKLVFDNTSQLAAVRQELQTLVSKRQQQQQERGTDAILQSLVGGDSAQADWSRDPLLLIQELREYDVPYAVRVGIDLQLRCGTWYTVGLNHDLVEETGGVVLSDPDATQKAQPVCFAFDIECTKAPLKFPSAEVDEIFMISYMVTGPGGTSPQGYLIVSRSIVSQDVNDFEYTPQPKYPGPFTILNEPNEEALLRRFVTEFQRHAPQIVVTYNGDFFDWPFVQARCETHGMNLYRETGVSCFGGFGGNRNGGSSSGGGEYRGRGCVHLDAFCWVQRDSYLPQGAQGLKAVTKYKLGYDPVEVDPEDMVRFAQERPVHMATYSVSDAVATYYLYEKYVHLFIFSLCSVIPMGPEDVLRKGSGTLCETLLMVQACSKDIICPNKQVDGTAKFHKGHLLESETYIGGKVECLETGVYRSDIEYDFDLVPEAFQQLIDNIDRDLTFAIEVEAGHNRSDICNYDSIRSEIVQELEMLRDRPKRVEKPYIYHLDVGAMYPNIILTNRLQPSAMVDDATCAACDYNQVKNGCKRHMTWIWRGDYNPATRNEYERTKEQLSREAIDGESFASFSEREQAKLVSDRLKTYSRKAYKKTKVTEEETRKDVVCMRENDFYVDTVRQFRDRRYEYKKLNKKWKKKRDTATDIASKKDADDRVLVYDSLQVAHKCILNSFYGYVMRKGARWRSMEMAGVVTKTGADIITQARILVEQIGRPLELDTDGIWCILPKSFPDVYTFVTSDGSKVKLEYPCVMLNADVHDKFTNHQYQTLVDPARGVYETRSECSIFFEVDGPYRCMVLPASTEEGKLLKKRYAVFNFDGSLAELKGFELKRRGELELIKTFQSQVFERFLEGGSLQECYECVAEVANHWIDVIDTRGESLDDDELVDLISENRSMSRQLDDYGDQKGTSQTTARRLGEFLGSEIIKDKGLNCKFIIAEQPYGAPVTERAIPTNIWKAESGVMKHYLRKWLKAPGLDGDALDIRNVLDWDYYLDRLGKTIQKIITIPAALQKIPNPVPRVSHPSWLTSKVNQRNDRLQQKSILDMFGPKKTPVGDIEDISSSGQSSKRPMVHSMARSSTSSRFRQKGKQEVEEVESQARVQLSKESFSDWLRHKKVVWRTSLRKSRSKRSSMGKTGIEKKQRKAISMDGFVREAAQSLQQREWQVIEIRQMSSYDGLSTSPTSSGSGNFAVWVLVGSDSLQKVTVSVPRIIHVSTRREVLSDNVVQIRKVDKHLPHSQQAAFVYEVSMPEHLYKSKEWTSHLRPAVDGEENEDIIESIYETKSPLMTRILSELGSVARPRENVAVGRKTYSLSDLSRVDRPVDGEYFNIDLSYKRAFLYVKLHPRTKTGIVALYLLNGGSGSFKTKPEDDEDAPLHQDLTRPSQGSPATFDVGASCHIWVVKPGSRTGQRTVSQKQCEALFEQLIGTIQEAAGLESDYACVSPESHIRMSNLSFVDNENLAYAAANETISSRTKSSHGPTVILVNSSQPTVQLRRFMSTFTSHPVVSLPFPPGLAHSPKQWTFPALNWEQPAVQLCFEAYLFMVVVSFPKRVSYARYGQVPIGNLGDDENSVLYDISLSRLIQKNRVLSWASPVHGRPDMGMTYLALSEAGGFPDTEACSYNQEDIWGDDDELVSPVIRRSGCYRSICVDIDIQDLAIAALTDMSDLTSNVLTGGADPHAVDPTSPNSVTLFDAGFGLSKIAGPLGDEMATSVSLPIVRALIAGWLRDAFSSGSLVADELLHHVFRIISDPDVLLHDPALHRVVHSLMKTTFMRILGELQRLGCSIVYASFHKIVVATNKFALADAEEYINFVISTARKGSRDEGGSVLSRVSLQPRQFHTQFAFLDEYNFGTMLLERMEGDDVSQDDLVMPEEGRSSVVVASVVTAWSVMDYLGSEIAQEYFRAIIGRFSKDVLVKQMSLKAKEEANHLPLVGADGLKERLLQFKKKMISKHFAAYLTRAVDEISNDEVDNEFVPPLLGDRSRTVNSALEFIKNVIVVLELDTDVENEVHVLKRSLLAQIGVAEYAQVAQWVNPCPTFILPDVFCGECQETRDVNLCYLPQKDSDDGSRIQWVCEDCGTPYSVDSIERRLLVLLHRNIVRYQMQDVRYSKTNRVVTRILAPAVEGSNGLKLDISPDDARKELQLLHGLAELHELDSLKEQTCGLLSRHR